MTKPGSTDSLRAIGEKDGSSDVCAETGVLWGVVRSVAARITTARGELGGADPQ